VSDATPIPDDAVIPIGLEVKNIMGVRAVRLTFDPAGGVYFVGGENHQGKTSTLTALRMCIEGAAAAPSKVLRSGTTRGESKLRLQPLAGGDPIEVHVVVTQSGQRLELRDPEGVPMRRPQEKLSALLSAVGFDPLEFAELAQRDPAKAGESLRKLVGLDFSDLVERQERAAEQRKTARRERDTIATQLEGMPPLHKDAPAEETAPATLTAKLTEANAEVARRASMRNDLIAAEEDERRASKALDDANELIAKLERDLHAARALAATGEALLDQKRAHVLELKGAIEELPAEPDVAGILAEISANDDRNRKVRENASRRAAEAKRDEHQRTFDKAQEEIDAVTEERRKRIRSAKYPIDGLAFDETATTVLLNDVPIQQVSDEERVRVSLAVGMALNPKLRALVIGRAGNDLDKRARATLHELALANRFLILAERVGDGEEVSVVIEDGEVREDRTAKGGEEGGRSDARS
jgi:hypothetical protein